MGGFVNHFAQGVAQAKDPSILAANREKEMQFKLAPLSQAILADQTRLALYADPNDPSKAITGKEKEYDDTVNRMTQTIGQMRGILGEKPGGSNPLEVGAGNVLDKLHITNHLKSHVAQAREKAAGEYDAQNRSTAGAYATGALPYEQTPAGQKHKDTMDEIKARGASKQSGIAGRPVQSLGLTIDSAIGLHNSPGIEYLGTDGKPIDLEAVKRTDPNAKLVPLYQGKDLLGYVIGDQKNRLWTWDNERHIVGEYGVNPQGGGTVAAGAARVPTVHTSTSPGGGQVVTGTTSPVTPGRASAIIPAGPKTASLSHARDVSRAATEGILPNIQNMTPMNARMAQKAQPAVTAELGLFGDPTKPEVKSMVDFASLADDHHAQKVLGTAFKLLDQEMGDISQPGVIATLGSAVGWAGFKAQTEARVQQEAGASMTNEEKEYFDTAIASMADIIGSRAATGQSPARFSVKAMQNELPLIGTSSVTDKNSYMTKMGTIARQIEVGLNGMPDNGRALAWMRHRQQEMQPKKGGSQGASPKAKHSLSKAMALPFNKGKTKAQVRADLESHHYEVIP